MSNTSEVPFPSGGQSGKDKNKERPIGGHEHPHGRPRSWVLVGVVIAAFIAGGFAVVGHLWPLFWVCAGIVVLAIPAGKVIGIMDDTVMVEPLPGQAPQPEQREEDRVGSAASEVRSRPDQGIR